MSVSPFLLHLNSFMGTEEPIRMFKGYGGRKRLCKEYGGTKRLSKGYSTQVSKNYCSLDITLILIWLSQGLLILKLVHSTTKMQKVHEPE